MVVSVVPQGSWASPHCRSQRRLSAQHVSEDVGSKTHGQTLTPIRHDADNLESSTGKERRRVVVDERPRLGLSGHFNHTSDLITVFSSRNQNVRYSPRWMTLQPPGYEPIMPTDLHSPRVRPRPSQLDLEITPERKARGIVALTVETPTSSRPRQTTAPRPPARWRTPEFIFYAVCFVIVVPFLFKVPMDLSERTCRLAFRSQMQTLITALEVASNPNYSKYQHKLSKGWIGGRQVVRGL